MSSSKLVALTDYELEFFFGGPTNGLERLRQLPDVHFIDPLLVDGDWHDLLDRIRPSILVSGWRTPMLSKRPKELNYVCHVGGSVRKLVTRELIKDGLSVTNWGECVSETVAEATLMLILSALRRSHYYSNMMHVRKEYSSFPRELPARTKSLFGSKIGIHGFGSVVQKLIPLLRPFRPSIAVFCPTIPEADFAAWDVSKCASLDNLFSQSDVVVELEALRADTRGIVSERILRLMKPDATFVNVGRGQVVDELALAQMAREGAIRVALDVYAQEPLPPDSPFRALPAVTLFPHVAAPADDRSYLCGDFALKNLERFYAGLALEAIVTTEIYDRST